MVWTGTGNENAWVLVMALPLLPLTINEYGLSLNFFLVQFIHMQNGCKPSVPHQGK